jgi:hypothetical protein
MTDREILNLSDRETKRKLLSRIGALSGAWQLELKQWRPRRSNRANSYYWAAVIPTFREFLREQGQFFTGEEIHDFLKAKLLPVREIHDPNTGEVIGAVPARSSGLASAACARFVDDAINWLGSTFGIVVPDPSLYRAA